MTARRNAEDGARHQSDLAALTEAVAGIEEHNERLVRGALCVTQRPTYEPPQLVDKRPHATASLEQALFGVLWPDGIPAAFPDRQRPWHHVELARWFAATAAAQGIEPPHTSTSERVGRGLFGTHKVTRKLEPAWVFGWTVGLGREKPRGASIEIFPDGHTQFGLGSTGSELELEGLAAMAKELLQPTVARRGQAREQALELLPEVLEVCAALQAQGREAREPPDVRWAYRGGPGSRDGRPIGWQFAPVIFPFKGEPTVWTRGHRVKLPKYLRSASEVDEGLPSTLSRAVSSARAYLARRVPPV